ncbi:MAG: hypothetical protein D6706_16575 [Chloroflexi bacterium]|nr:MAG: hypothetical protein D6706_16575 [Chloroflexota bacterium]
MMELREIELKNQKDAIETEKATAVSAAQDKLDAAQAEHEAAQKRLELQEALLQQQIEMNNLLAGTVESLSAMGGGAGAVAGGIKGLTDSFTGLGQVGAGVATTLSQSMSELAQNIMSEFEGLGTSAETLGQTWGTVVANAKTRWGGLVRWFSDQWGEGGTWENIMEMATSIYKTQWGEGGTWDGIAENAKRTVDLVIDKWKEHWGEGGTWDNIIKMATDLFKEHWGKNGTWDGIMENIKTAVSLVADKFKEKMDAIKQDIANAKDVIQELWNRAQGFWEWLKSAGFDFNFSTNIPESHDAHSPLPLHTAWKNFDRFLSNRSFNFDFASSLEEPMVSQRAVMSPATAVASMPAGEQVFNKGDMHIYNGMDEAELRAKVLMWARQDSRGY